VSTEQKCRFKSAGLLEKSKNKYFDWLLEDPKDEPYVTFRFHYRSWDSLEALQLIPEDCNRELLPAFSTKHSLGTSCSFQGKPNPMNSQLITSFNKATAKGWPDGPNRLPTKDIKNTVFGRMVAKDTTRSAVRPNHIETAQSDANDRPKQKYRIPTSSFSTSNSTKPTSRITQQQGVRPLPELPTGKSPVRKSSAASSSFSIAPSLQSWADDDRSESPEPVFGVAAEVQVLHSPQLNHYGRKKSIFDDDSSTSSAGDYSDACSEIDKAFLSSLSAPPTYSKNASPIKRPTALGLTLPASAIFPPPAMRRNRMRRVLFQDERTGYISPSKGYEADHEDLNSYYGSSNQNMSGSPPNLKLSQIPQRLLAVNVGFSFEFDNPCTGKKSKVDEDIAVGTENGRVEKREGEASFTKTRIRLRTTRYP
jgi:hypothetical protein